MRGPLLIVGASGRAAAASALRAGYEPFVIDLFADADTRQLAPVVKCDWADYPQGFVPLAKQAPPGPWMYTGGLENHPEIVAEISAIRPLMGNGPTELANVRDPFRLAEQIRRNGGRFPETRTVGTLLPQDGCWLRKSIASAGGLQVRFAGTDNTATSTTSSDYFQQFLDGKPGSALYRQDELATCLFGVTVQLSGCKWLHAPPFAYAGNIVARDRERSLRLLPTLAAFQNLGLKHSWGVDFLDTGTGPPYTLEVNPRYTASVEVLEYATRRVYLGPVDLSPSPRSVVGKGIYYAAKSLTFPDSGPWQESLRHCTDVWRRPDFADIPDPGSRIERGQPVLTLFAEARTEPECEAELRRIAGELDKLFDVGTVEEGR